MSAFSADWLSLREPVDARARSRNLPRELPDTFPAIIDLGAGTGATLRWLAPMLGPEQQWLLVDNDDALLAEAGRRLLDWSAQNGYQARQRGSELEISGGGFDCRVSTRVLDLSQSSGEIVLPRGCLVTASALLDLVSEDWLAAFAARVTAAGACVLWMLSYTGHVSLNPVHAEDRAIVGLVNRHQLTDKGFGPAIGPDAHAVARDLLAQAAYRVAEADSSWHCGPDARGFFIELIEGWADAARDVSPQDSARIESWRQQRLDLALSGGLQIEVSHSDLVALPPVTPG